MNSTPGTERANTFAYIDVLLKRGRAAHAADDVLEAARLYDEILSAEPEHAQALHYRGVAAYQMADRALALDMLRRAAAALPQDALVASNLAEVLQNAGQPVQAEAEARRALGLQSGMPEARLNLSVALFAQHRHAEAEQQARAALLSREDWVPALQVLADTFREQQRVREAEGLYRRVLALSPGHSAASSNLGWMLVQQGRMDEGLALCRQASAERLDDPEIQENLVRALLEFGRIEDAMSALEKAIETWPKSARLSMLLGSAWNELGDPGEAIAWLNRAWQLAPALPEPRIRLAGVLIDLDQLEPAAAVLEEVIRDHPRHAEAYLARGRCKLAAGDAQGALADHRSAAEISPDSAHIHAAFGNALANAGELPSALEAYRRALAANPRCVPAHAGLLTTLRGKAEERDGSAARELLGAWWMSGRWRAGLLFGLAVDGDGRGRWAEAADLMVQANAQRKEAEARRGHAYDPKAYEAWVDRIIETFTPSLFERLRGFGSESRRPVFVVGMPRSGTTLTEQILASHPEVHGAGERRFAAQGFTGLPRWVGGQHSDPIQCLAGAGQAELQAAADWHLEQLEKLDHGKALRVVDKMPDNYSLLGWLAVLFPYARFIHCQRDLRDVALSCWITNFAAIAWANDLDHLAHRLLQYRRLMRHWQRVLPVSMHTVDYEAMVADQRTESERLVAAAGLEWSESCMAFHETPRLVRTASVSQVRQPIYNRSVARWTHYQSMLQPLIDRLEGELTV